MTIENACLAGRSNIENEGHTKLFHQIYTEEINKIVLSSDDDKTSYYGRRNTHSSLRTYILKKL